MPERITCQNNSSYSNSKAVPVDAMETYRRSRGTAPPIDPGMRWRRRVVNFTHWPLYLHKKNPWYLLNSRHVCWPCRDLTHRPSSLPARVGTHKQCQAGLSQVESSQTLEPGGHPPTESSWVESSWVQSDSRVRWAPTNRVKLGWVKLSPIRLESQVGTHQLSQAGLSQVKSNQTLRVRWAPTNRVKLGWVESNQSLESRGRTRTAASPTQSTSIH